MMQPIIEPKPYPISFTRFKRFILGKVHPRTMKVFKHAFIFDFTLKRLIFFFIFKGSTISVGLISLICVVLIFVSTTDKMFKGKCILMLITISVIEISNTFVTL